MASPVKFKGSNAKLTIPNENIDDLEIHRNGSCVSSCWELTDQELKDINRTGKVWVTLLSGDTQPPMFIGSEKEVRSVVVDYGDVWKKTEESP